MKTFRLFLGIAALVFAFTSAFAIRGASLAEDPAYINAEGQCERVEVTCGGSLNDCKVSGITIREFQEGTTCAAVLKMN